MTNKRSMAVLALCFLGLTGTASAQQRNPNDCYRDARWAPAWCGQYLESVSRNGEIKQAPKDSRRSKRAERPEEYLDREMSSALEQVPDQVIDKAGEELGNAMQKAVPRFRGPLKSIGKGKDIYDGITDYVGYARDEAIEWAAPYAKEVAKSVLKNAPRTVAAGGAAAVILY